jgi:hypothetical protein
MNTIVDCYGLHLVRLWHDADGVIRAKNETHKYVLASMDYDYYEHENRVYTPSDKISGEGSVMLDFREATTALEAVESLQRDIANDIYTDKSVVVLTIHDDDDGSLNYVENWVRSRPGVDFAPIPEYLRRSHHPDDMFVKECDYSHERCNFAVVTGVSFCFLYITRPVVSEKTTGEKRRRAVVDEPRTPLTRTISVHPTPEAIDPERRVFGDFYRFVKHFQGHIDLAACASISLHGKHLVCFNKVIQVSPPIIRATSFVRDTGEKETRLLHAPDVELEGDVVIMHRKRPVDINKVQMNAILGEFMRDCAGEVNGDVSMKLHDFYVLFHSFCQHQHGVFLSFVHMHLWFFDACADLYSAWVVKRDEEYYIRCMHVDVPTMLTAYEARGWNVHKGLARLELKQ